MLGFSVLRQSHENNCAWTLNTWFAGVAISKMCLSCIFVQSTHQRWMTSNSWKKLLCLLPEHVLLPGTQMTSSLQSIYVLWPYCSTLCVPKHAIVTDEWSCKPLVKVKEDTCHPKYHLAWMRHENNTEFCTCNAVAIPHGPIPGHRAARITNGLVDAVNKPPVAFLSRSISPANQIAEKRAIVAIWLRARGSDSYLRAWLPSLTVCTAQRNAAPTSNASPTPVQNCGQYLFIIRMNTKVISKAVVNWYCLQYDLNATKYVAYGLQAYAKATSVKVFRKMFSAFFPIICWVKLLCMRIDMKCIFIQRIEKSTNTAEIQQTLPL